MNRKFLAIVALSSTFLVGCSSNNHDKAEAEACHSEDVLTAEAKPKAVEEKAAPVAKFGTEFTVNDAAQAVTVDQVLADPQKYAGQRVRLTGGNVTSVCAKKGCWLRVAPKSTVASSAKFSDIFIKFTDPSTGHLVPMEAVGHDTELEGIVKVGMMPEASARHFKMDAGAPKEEIEKIVGPQPQVVLQQASVAVQGIEQPKTGA